jgi:hypothetical protein
LLIAAPVVLSFCVGAANRPAIARDLYQAVRIRMMAEGRREIKIKITIGEREFKQNWDLPGDTTITVSRFISKPARESSPS